LPALTTPVNSETHVPYVDVHDSDAEVPTPKKTAPKGGSPSTPTKGRKPIVIFDSESDESEIQAVPTKKKKAVKEEGTTDKARNGGRGTSGKGKKVVVVTDSESEDLEEVKEQKKRPRTTMTASEAKKQKAADMKIKKEELVTKPGKINFNKSAREAIKNALDMAASPMKGRKGN
jgi:hypothetical protein